MRIWAFEEKNKDLAMPQIKNKTLDYRKKLKETGTIQLSRLTITSAQMSEVNKDASGAYFFDFN